MHFDPIAETLSTLEGLVYKEQTLGCDTASFKIIGRNETTVHTLSDGYYGNVFEANSGETLITFYVTHDAMVGEELEEKVLYALGI